ncbi:sideroflexin-3-like [Ostrinia furnacalis]|uniref:sideroflexin-3-like n=1 Tax=Ostrinia furnacalis TaxID=93504 RepID=UPI00103B2B68|nr:sideroflexin-3-like [Ostrinia furnacalis]
MVVPVVPSGTLRDICHHIFPQRAAIDVESLEPELKAKTKYNFPKAKELYYNKGL